METRALTKNSFEIIGARNHNFSLLCPPSQFGLNQMPGLKSNVWGLLSVGPLGEFSDFFSFSSLFFFFFFKVLLKDIQDVTPDKIPLAIVQLYIP